MSAGIHPDLSKVRRVLVIKLRNHGDVLLTAPIFSALKSRLPEARIDAYVYRDTVPMLEGHAAISAFHQYDRKWKALSVLSRWRHEFALLNAIRRAGYDMTVNLTDGDRGTVAASYSGAGIRVALNPEGHGFTGKRRLITHVVKRAATPRHMVEQNLDALRRIGIFPDPSERQMHFAIPDDARSAVMQRLARHGIAGRDYLLIHPTSRWLFKCWPAGRVAELIDTLSLGDFPVVLSCGPDERERAMIEAIKRATRHARLIDLGGMLTLKELGALIEQAQCLLCVDSVPMHMAAALRVPTVALFGPSSDQIWSPWDNAHATIVTRNLTCRPCGLDGCGGSKKSDCLESLPVSDVLRVVKSKLKLPAPVGHQ